MISNAAKGAYYKSRTRKWLTACGWQVADMEIVRWLFTPKGRIPVKRDQFGADLLAMTGRKIVFVQVKGGKAAEGHGTFPAARRVFQQFLFPPHVECWVVAWAPRTPPRIVDVTPVHLLSERTGTHVQKESRQKEQSKQVKAERRRLATSQAQSI